MLNRRQFLQMAAAAGSGTALKPIRVQASRYQNSSGFFGLHSFVENHPEAVFIMRTDVDVKTNSEAIKDAALTFARSIFVPKDDGVPVTHLIPIKPNLVGPINSKYSFEYQKGIDTDPYFVEGLIEGMKELGLSGNQFFLREVNKPEFFETKGFTDVAERTGADIRDMSAKVGQISENDLVWMDVPEGVWFRNIPYLWPVNASDTWLLNIAKFKAHGMGLTLCCKNLQGSIAHNYQSHCSYLSMDMNPVHRNPTAVLDIKDNHARHLADGIPRWDRPGSNWNSGLGMEAWISRCLDNNSATPVGLNIIEGIYGRDGNGFLNGPNPPGNEDNSTGEAWDYMTNVIIFGKDRYRTDIIGNWLGCHEPGNFGLFHIAMERGLSSVLNPESIPVYEWKNGEAVLTPLGDFERTPIMTYYLQRNYNEQEEKYYHLVNEPFDYSSVYVDKSSDDSKPGSFILHQNRPNPFNPYTAIEFSVPQGGYVRLDVYTINGQLVDVLVDGYYSTGAHLVVWNTNRQASGTYIYRFRYGGFTETRKMVLLK